VKVNKLKSLSIAICCFISALWSEIQGMEEGFTQNPVTLKVEELHEYYRSRSSDLIISFAGQPIDYENCLTLSTVLSHISARRVSFNNCIEIKDAGIKVLADAFSTMPDLEVIDLYNIGISDEGCKYLCKKLMEKVKSERNLDLIKLEIRGNNLLTEISLIELINLKKGYKKLILVDDFSPEVCFKVLSMVSSS
jgi:hypothetical protein